MAKDKICIEAFKKGCPNFKGPILWGTSENNLELIRYYKNKGIDFVYIDMPFFDETRIHFTKCINNSQFRVLFNSFHPEKILNVPDDRFKKLNITVMRWKRVFSKKILYIESSKKTTDFFGGKDFSNKLIAYLTNKFNLEVKIRKKYSSKLVAETTPFRKDIDGCFATISLMSIGSIKSLVLGIPVFCFKENVASFCGISFSKLEDIKNINPFYSEKRNELFNFLAYNQFSLEEISKGLPYSFKKTFKT